jgi:transcriptional regulator with XRE-family HTH domain
MSDAVYKRVVRWRIKGRRLELGLRQEDVAEGADISLRRFQEYENARIYFNPTFDMLLRFAKALDMDLATLLVKPSKEEIEQSRQRITKRVFKK